MSPSVSLNNIHIDTLSGGSAAGEAVIQVLILPVLILGWGLTVAAAIAFT